MSVIHFDFRPQQFEHVILESDVSQQRSAQFMENLHSDGITESHLHIEFTPAFSAGNWSWLLHLSVQASTS
jgi:hypothetical protein